MAKTYININGETREASSLTFPSTGRQFRGAWQFNGSAIEVDMVTARELFRNRVRAARKPELEKLDAEFMQALEGTKGDTSAIVSRKKALRDATKDPAIEAASTPEELLKVKPAGLEV